MERRNFPYVVKLETVNTSTLKITTSHSATKNLVSLVYAIEGDIVIDELRVKYISNTNIITIWN